MNLPSDLDISRGTVLRPIPEVAADLASTRRWWSPTAGT